MKPSIAIIIPSYNSAPFIERTVASVLHGNLGSHDELIVVDDHSTDSTVAVVETLQRQDARIQLLKHRHNRGLGAAGINTGIERAKSDIFFCLDHDNELVPDSIPSLLDFMLSNGAEAASLGETRNFVISDGKRVSTDSWIYKPGELLLSDALAGKYWPGPSGNYLFTRDSWLRAGRYDESVSPAIDCWAFGIMQLATGTRFLIQEGSFYHHRQGLDSQWVIASRRENVSLAALRVMGRILKNLEPREERYLFSRYGRRHWLGDLELRPIRVKGQSRGMSGAALDSDGRRKQLQQSLKRRLRRSVARVTGL